MSEERERVLKLPEELIERIDRVMAVMADDPELETFGPVDRATVIRLAVACGLRVIEDEYGIERRTARVAGDTIAGQAGGRDDD